MGDAEVEEEEDLSVVGEEALFRVRQDLQLNILAIVADKKGTTSKIAPINPRTQRISQFLSRSQVRPSGTAFVLLDMHFLQFLIFQFLPTHLFLIVLALEQLFVQTFIWKMNSLTPKF